MLEKLYTVEEVAELASVTGRTIRNYLKSGRLVGRKIGGQWRFPESEVQRLLSGADTQPAASPAADSKIYENTEKPAENPQAYQEPPAQSRAVQPPPQISPDEEDDFSLPVFIDDSDASVPGQNGKVAAHHQAQQPQLTYSFNYETKQDGINAVETPDYIGEDNSRRQAQPYKIPEKLAFLPETHPPAPPQVRSPNPAVQSGQDYKDLAQLPPKNYPEQQDSPPQINAFPYKQNQPVPPQPAFTEPPFEYGTANINSLEQQGEAFNRPQIQPTVESSRHEQLTAEPSPRINSGENVTLRQGNNRPDEEKNIVGEKQEAAPNEKEGKEEFAFVGQLSEVGIKAAKFPSQVHTEKAGGDVCCVIDLNEALELSKAKLEALFKLIENKADNTLLNEVYLEYDERIAIARYTIFGNLKFLNKCVEIISR